MRNELQAAVRYFEMRCEGKTDFEALAMCDRREMERTALSALRDALQRQPDPIIGLMPCGWCGPERIGRFNVQFWVRASTGKRKWMSVTQKYKKQVNYCPMCGRKLEVEG